MSLTSEIRDQYVEIIDSILDKSDLNTISEKRIRKGLQEVVGYDLTPQKSAVKQLIMERFDIYAEKNGVGSPEETTASNGHKEGDLASAVPSPPPSSSPVKRDPDSDASSPVGSEPPAKKRKPEADADADADVDADAVYAAKLQAEENLRARPTRGGNTRRAAPSKKKSKAKTSKRVKAEDDSDIESGSDRTTKKEVNRTGGFHKPLNLSPPLSALLGGEVTLSRPQTVKKVWEYIRENQLQDPSDRRQIRCDDAMRAVFKQDRVHMFTMTKILNQNLYSPDE
ncbi:uncharacterized protein N7477_006150 [Penicillium maclennaniae]|uniref:uncharacterized protein n=1 Tax=Penicillium maclennaniae TaxID=1343394 RepID=UPI0025402AEB|nr:uncharacterized protein N7477_006150 [Penicillium maclennaniae]KAJ5670787.1 hypothetical protein N7477_006150 [Penicillium maclennaniae]